MGAAAAVRISRWHISRAAPSVVVVVRAVCVPSRRRSVGLWAVYAAAWVWPEACSRGMCDEADRSEQGAQGRRETTVTRLRRKRTENGKGKAEASPGRDTAYAPRSCLLRPRSTLRSTDDGRRGPAALAFFAIQKAEAPGLASSADRASTWGEL